MIHRQGEKYFKSSKISASVISSFLHSLSNRQSCGNDICDFAKWAWQQRAASQHSASPTTQTADSLCKHLLKACGMFLCGLIQIWVQTYKYYKWDSNSKATLSTIYFSKSAASIAARALKDLLQSDWETLLVEIEHNSAALCVHAKCDCFMKANIKTNIYMRRFSSSLCLVQCLFAINYQAIRFLSHNSLQQFLI